MKIILASKSGVRKNILDKYQIESKVVVSNVDEDEVKASLLSEGADPLIISKNLAEIKSIKISSKNPNRLVLGADSVISLNNELINKPKSREDAFEILESKLLGDFTEHTKWWDDGEDLEKNRGILKTLGIVSLVIFVILILLTGDEDGFLFFVTQLGAEAFCGLILFGGGALTSLNRSDSGKFIK